MVDNEEATGKRITLKRKRPNPLFQDWLEELYGEAKAKKSKLENMLNEALASLSKYPLPLESGADCLILKGFDRKLCKFLDMRLDTYRSNSILEPHLNQPQSSEDADTASLTSSQSKTSVRESPSVSTKTTNTSSPESSQSKITTKTTNTSSPESSQSKTTTTTTNTLSPESSQSKTSTRTTNTSSQESISSVTKAHKQKKSTKGCKPYKPVFRSGSYAILRALLEHATSDNENNALKKDVLINRAQKYCEESFVRPKPESFYTAWSNMSNLVKKGLVTQTRGKKALYSLTNQGFLLAADLLEESKDVPTTNDIIFNGASSSNNELVILEPTREPASRKTTREMVEVEKDVFNIQRIDSEIRFIEMPAGSFDVILLIDKNETGGLSKKNDPTVAQFNKYPDLKHEYRSLKVGDFTWIARHKASKEELVLPYVAERKRMDDLGASIRDGRFHEQKFRLRKCGLKNVIYLVENYGSNNHVGLPIPSLKQALVNTRVQDEFKVHTTDSLSNSARYLAMMTKRLTIEYKDTHLVGCNKEPQGEELMTFMFFNKSSSKNKPLTVTETFIKLLLQIKGVSVEKALAITKVYNTPRLLMKEYETCSKKEGEMLLASLKDGDLTRKVGPSASKSIYKFFVWDKH